MPAIHNCLLISMKPQRPTNSLTKFKQNKNIFEYPSMRYDGCFSSFNELPTDMVLKCSNIVDVKALDLV